MFSNIDIDPGEKLRIAETEFTLWTEAQLLNTQRAAQSIEVRNLQSIQGDGVSQMVHGKIRNYFQDKAGIAPYRVLMVY